MTHTQQYLHGTLAYEKLSEDEQNGIVAGLENIFCPTCKGIGQISGYWVGDHSQVTPPATCNFCNGSGAPDYLHDWLLVGPLIEKYGLGVWAYGNGVAVARCWATNKHEAEEIIAEAVIPQAAIVYALCEIAKEKEKENEQSNSSNSSS